MKRSAFILTLTAAAIAVASLFQPAAVRAAEVTLTSGSVVVNCTGNPNSNTGRIDLIGPDFNLHFLYDGSGALCSPAPVFRHLTGGPVYDGVIASASFQGVTTMFTRGSLSFDETSITGVVEGTSGQFGPALFTVNFSGTGTGVITTTQSTFNVNAVPEPATLILFGTGAALFGGARRWRKARKRRDSSADLQRE